MALTNAKTLTNVVLIIKNGSATGWAETSYRLQKGELGICYLDNGNVIIKAGVDGNTAWADCPQVEGVFETDLTLTYPFGKYRPDASGSVTVPVTGMTAGEAILDAFSEEDFDGLIVSRPSASFAVTGGRNAEVGETYNTDIAATLTLNPNGSYKYGAKSSAGVAGQTDIAFISANIYKESATDANLLKTIEDAASNRVTYTQTVASNVLSDTAVSYSFVGEAAYGADANRPLTNLGKFVKDAANKISTKNFDEAVGFIPAATALGQTKRTVTYSGYRKMFMGTTTAASPEVNSTFVRGLTKVSEKAAKTQKDITASAGDTAIYWAWPTSLTSAAPTFQYYFMGAWQDLAGPVLVGKDIQVNGANGYAAVPYTVYKYSPNSGVFEGSMQTRIKIN